MLWKTLPDEWQWATSVSFIQEFSSHCSGSSVLSAVWIFCGACSSRCSRITLLRLNCLGNCQVPSNLNELELPSAVFKKSGSWFLIILLAFNLPVTVLTQMAGGTWFCHIAWISLFICAELGLYRETFSLALPTLLQLKCSYLCNFRDVALAAEKSALGQELPTGWGRWSFSSAQQLWRPSWNTVQCWAPQNKNLVKGLEHLPHEARLR